MFALAHVWLTAHFSNVTSLLAFFYYFFWSQLDSSYRSTSRAVGRFWQLLGLLLSSASFPPSLQRQHHISQSFSGCVCWSFWGPIICSQKTNSFLAGLVEKQSANNVLWKNRSCSVIHLCGFFHPIDNDLQVFAGQTLLWVACVPCKNLCFFTVLRSLLPSFQDMLQHVPGWLLQTGDETRISAAGPSGLLQRLRCCFYRKYFHAFSVLLQFQLPNNWLDRC